MNTIKATKQPEFLKRLEQIYPHGCRIGFTGPRRGMSEQQQACLKRVLQSLPGWISAHHGDCIGADAEFHELCLLQKIPVHIHPPTNDNNRSFCQGASFIAKEKAYLQRNRDIVHSADLLVATPPGSKEVQRSGIWASIRYARKAHKLILMIPPNGDLLIEDHSHPP